MHVCKSSNIHKNQDQRREIQALVSERDPLKADNARLTSRNLAVESTLEELEYEAHKFEDGAQRFYGTVKTLRLKAPLILQLHVSACVDS